VSDDPREALLAVAREIIAKRGYVGLSMRTASAAAGVTEDVARRYYRNRDSLFAAAMRLPVDPVSAIPALMAPGIEGMGERLVRFTLDTLRDPEAREDLMSLARTGVSAGHAVTGLQEFIEIGVVDRVAGMIGVPDARMRSALITSYLLGVATMRYGVRLEPLASASDEEVIRMVAPVIQDLLDPRRPIPGSARARARSGSSAAGSAQTAHTAPRARTFDPDPAATRAAEAARLAALAARTPSPKPARAAAPPAPARPAPARPAPARPAAAEPTAPVRQEAVTKASARKAPASSAPAKRVAATTAPPTEAAKPKKAAAKAAPAKKAAATRAPARKAPATRTPATAPAPGAAAPTGPKHAQPAPDPAPPAPSPNGVASTEKDPTP
jgi:AcrR family transcriptional regulator